jgi:hypothetical protein
VPAVIEGVWYFPVHASQMTLQGTGYAIEATDPPGAVLGNLVVNGDEIDFFNGGGCGLALPQGVGRYQWTLADGTSLHFTPLNEDNCGRADILTNQTWTRAPTPP